jgi:hypothetical protein
MDGTSKADDMAMDFYDCLAPLYHLIFPNWNDSIQRQGE